MSRKRKDWKEVEIQELLEEDLYDSVEVDGDSKTVTLTKIDHEDFEAFIEETDTITEKEFQKRKGIELTDEELDAIEYMRHRCERCR